MDAVNVKQGGFPCTQKETPGYKSALFSFFVNGTEKVTRMKEPPRWVVDTEEFPKPKREGL